jgi:hypothetical protein
MLFAVDGERWTVVGKSGQRNEQMKRMDRVSSSLRGE